MSKKYMYMCIRKIKLGFSQEICEHHDLLFLLVARQRVQYNTNVIMTTKRTATTIPIIITVVEILVVDVPSSHVIFHDNTYGFR